MNFRRGSSTRKRARVSIERSDERRTERLLSDGLKRIIFISVVRKQFQLLSTNESSTVEPSGYMNTLRERSAIFERSVTFYHANCVFSTHTT